jgi:hypothetical protein
MAANVLTTAVVVQCPHVATITFTSTAVLHVDGAPVVRESDLALATFACVAQTKCASVLAAPGSTSTLLQDGGSAVVLVAGLKTNNGSCTITGASDLLQTD